MYRHTAHNRMMMFSHYNSQHAELISAEHTSVTCIAYRLIKVKNMLEKSQRQILFHQAFTLFVRPQHLIVK